MSAVDQASLPKRPRVLHGAAVRVWRGMVAVGRAVPVPPRALMRWWRRSTQARVVIGVLSLATVLAFVAGWVLLHQVKDGLLTSQLQSALPQAAAGFDTAHARLNSPDATNVCPSDPNSTTNICS